MFICRYFLGIPEGRPGQQHLYRVASVPPRTEATLHPPICLTCAQEVNPTSPTYYTVEDHYAPRTRQFDDEWSDEEPSILTTPPPRRKKKRAKNESSEPPCLFHNAIFSPKTAGFYVLECLGPGVPTSSLYQATMPKPKLLLVLQNNTKLREKIAKMAMPQTKTFPVQISGGFHAHVRLYLPPGLREDEITR